MKRVWRDYCQSVRDLRSMKRFIFSMQALYDVEKAKEKQTLTDYATAQEVLRTLEEKAKACRERIVQEQTHVDESARCGIFAGAFQNACAYMKGLRQQATILEQDVLKAREEVERVQQMLHKIYQDKKALERLRETQYQYFIAEQNAMESKATEDLLIFGMLDRMVKRDNPA